MTITLRALLVIAALITVIWILRQIRKFKVKMEDAIFWIFFAVVLLVLAIFPEICFALSELLGFMSPSNLVFVIIIFLLVEKIFTLSLIVSQLEEKISILSAEVALRSKAANRRLNDDEEITRELEELEEELQEDQDKRQVKDS